MSQHHPSSRRSDTEQKRVESAFREIYERDIRFDQLLGLKVESFDPTNPLLCFEMRPELLGHFMHGRLHGGVIASALDTVGGFAVALAITEKFCDETLEQLTPRVGRISTIDLRIDYLRQGIGERFHAQGRVIRLGGRIASVQMMLHNEKGELISTGAAAYVVS